MQTVRLVPFRRNFPRLARMCPQRTGHKQGFCLSHFSYLVNLAHVARVERDALTLDTGEAIPVSRRYYQDFMARYVESLK